MYTREYTQKAHILTIGSLQRTLPQPIKAFKMQSKGTRTKYHPDRPPRQTTQTYHPDRPPRQTTQTDHPDRPPRQTTQTSAAPKFRTRPMAPVRTACVLTLYTQGLHCSHGGKFSLWLWPSLVGQPHSHTWRGMLFIAPRLTPRVRVRLARETSYGPGMRLSNGTVHIQEEAQDSTHLESLSVNTLHPLLVLQVLL